MVEGLTDDDWEILCRGVDDYVAVGEVLSVLRRRSAHAPEEQSFQWIREMSDRGVVTVGNYDPHSPVGFTSWPERGLDLSNRMAAFMRSAPREDPQAPYMTLFLRVDDEVIAAMPDEWK